MPSQSELNFLIFLQKVPLQKQFQVRVHLCKKGINGFLKVQAAILGPSECQLVGSLPKFIGKKLGPTVQLKIVHRRTMLSFRRGGSLLNLIKFTSFSQHLLTALDAEEDVGERLLGPDAAAAAADAVVGVGAAALPRGRRSEDPAERGRGSRAWPRRRPMHRHGRRRHVERGRLHGDISTLAHAACS